MEKKVKRVYKGLPESYVGEVLWVAREFRTNPLSHVPGGSDVVVEYHEGEILGYDWIKYPSRYIRKIFNDSVSNLYSDFEERDTQFQLSVVKEKISKIFARTYDNREFEKVPFENIWDSTTATELPWVKLKRFDRRRGLAAYSKTYRPSKF